MANNHNDNNYDNSNVDSESSPLLEKQVGEEAEEEKKSNVDSKPSTAGPPPAEKSGSVAPAFGVYGWTADGLPLGDGSVMGEPMGRTQWDSSLCACLGRNDEFCSSDLEVCLLGSVAPCVLYGSNVERLGSAPRTFANHCIPYTGLYLIGNAYFGWNFLAPWFSHPSRTAIRRKFNLEGGLRHLTGHVGAVEAVWKMTCNVSDVSQHVILQPISFATLVLFCQEGRELRRRMPHPGFNAQPVLVMMPPGDRAWAVAPEGVSLASWTYPNLKEF